MAAGGRHSAAAGDFARLLRVSLTQLVLADLDGQSRSRPFREPVLEGSGAITTSAELASGLWGQGAVRTPAVGHYVDLPRQLLEPRSSSSIGIDTAPGGRRRNRRSRGERGPSRLRRPAPIRNQTKRQLSVLLRRRSTRAAAAPRHQPLYATSQIVTKHPCHGVNAAVGNYLPLRPREGSERRFPRDSHSLQTLERLTIPLDRVGLRNDQVLAHGLDQHQVGIVAHAFKDHQGW